MQEKRLKVRNNSIDLVKWMASLLVVSVHSDAFSDISPLMGHIINSVFGRMVVPFFACVTGYYLTEYSVEKPKMWLKNLKSLFKYYVLLSVIYVAWDAVCHHFSGMSVENIISTGGTCYDLTLVDKVADPAQNNKVKNNKATVRNELDIKSSTLNAIRSGMYMVVNNGSLKSVFQKVPVKVAGKTGTAQISANEPNHALFVSYAPYDSPKISVAVVMPNAFTSSNAASLASNVYQYYFDEKARKKLLKKSATNPVSNSRKY